MSAISDHDLERLARLMMYGDANDVPEIVRLLRMDIAATRQRAHGGLDRRGRHHTSGDRSGHGRGA